MPETKIADVIVPEIFLPYVTQKTAELSEYITSGIIETSDEFNRLVTSSGGKLVEMPYWNDLSGDDEVLSDITPLTVNPITSSKDVARKHIRGKSWGANDLAGILAGSDPMMVFGDRVADYKVRRIQAQVLATLTGTFASASMSGNSLDIFATSGTAGSDNFLTGVSWINAAQLMGDAKGKLTAAVMHSAVEASLLKQELIDFALDSEGKPTIKVFQGKRVIIDDTTPTEDVDGKTVYHTYLFGRGALAMGESQEDDPIEGGIGSWRLEYGRVPLQHSSYVIVRWRNIIHPRGIKWNESLVTGITPTNAEIATAANWTRVFDQKNVRIVRIRHNIPT